MERPLGTMILAGGYVAFVFVFGGLGLWTQNAPLMAVAAVMLVLAVGLWYQQRWALLLTALFHGGMGIGLHNYMRRVGDGSALLFALIHIAIAVYVLHPKTWRAFPPDRLLSLFRRG